jgi:uncharacterized protein (DUF2235 family)
MKARALCACTLLWLAVAAAAATASDAVAAARHRRLVLCLDGTQNSPEEEVETQGAYDLYKPTNVLKTYRAILPVGDDGVTTQVAYYSEGVGSFIGEPGRFGRLEVLVDRIFGGAFGVGYEARVKAAYRFLVANYQPRDQIFIFGFSRGAAEAQILARFIDWAGGLLHKEDEYYIAELYRGFADCQAQPGEAQELVDCIRERRAGDLDSTAPPLECSALCSQKQRYHCDATAPPQEGGALGGQPGLPCKLDGIAPRREDCFVGGQPRRCNVCAIAQPRPVEIDFLGVYDTVLSIGSRVTPEGKVTTVDAQHAYLVGPTPPKIVKKVRQALATDERRWDFRPQVWRGPAPERPHQDLMQRWFPGVHSNIGGGYRYDGLADRALAWMIGEAQSSGLAVDCDYLRHFTGPKGECYEPTRKDSYTTGAWLAELVRGKIGQGARNLAEWEGDWKQAGLGFHESLGELLINDCTYRPRNLLEFLAQDEGRIARFPLPAQQQKQIRQIVEDFKKRAGERAPKPYDCQPSLPCAAAAGH